MVLAEGTTNLMQRLSRLPSTPDVSPLRRRKPVPSSLSHNHHLHIRWGCIDRLSRPTVSRFRKFGQRDKWKGCSPTAIKMAEMRSNDDATSTPEPHIDL